VTNPLFLAGVVIVAGFVGTRYWQPRSSLAYFVIQLAGFVTVTGLLLAGGVVPYRPGVVGSERVRLFVSGLEIIWWLGAAWLTVGFLRAFVVLGRQPRESKLVQDLLAGLGLDHPGRQPSGKGHRNQLARHPHPDWQSAASRQQPDAA
jgi:hypothetical protein